MSHPNSEHGTTKSYIIGFALSLIFTAIPYYFVVNKTITGDALLATIILVAVLQMIIQIVFFLHLGRGPKPFYNIVFFSFTVITIVVVVGGSIWIMNHLHYNMAPTEVSKYLAEKEGIHQINGTETGACHGRGANHIVTIKGDRVSPSHVNAQLCDSLTFVNEDSEVREIAFGAHPEHGSYAGQSDVVLRTSRGKSIVLNEPGSYQFHDHIDPAVNGSFTVSGE